MRPHTASCQLLRQEAFASGLMQMTSLYCHRTSGPASFKEGSYFSWTAKKKQSTSRCRITFSRLCGFWLSIREGMLGCAFSKPPMWIPNPRTCAGVAPVLSQSLQASAHAASTAAGARPGFVANCAERERTSQPPLPTPRQREMRQGEEEAFA